VGRNPEAGKPYVAGFVDEHIPRLDVLMYKAVAMDLAECCRQANSDLQDPRQIERLPLVPLKNMVQGLTARVLEYEDRPPFVTSERQRRGCPRRLQFGCERIFVLRSPQTLRRWLFGGRRYCQNR